LKEKRERRERRSMMRRISKSKGSQTLEKEEEGARSKSGVKLRRRKEQNGAEHGDMIVECSRSKKLCVRQPDRTEG
jgi:hypothetical protein